MKKIILICGKISIVLLLASISASSEVYAWTKCSAGPHKNCSGPIDPNTCDRCVEIGTDAQYYHCCDVGAEPVSDWRHYGRGKRS